MRVSQPFVLFGGFFVAVSPGDPEFSTEKNSLMVADRETGTNPENPFATSRWSAQVKERIRVSRVQGTRVLCEGLAKMQRPPKVLVCASGVGFYGDRCDEELDEDSAAGAVHHALMTESLSGPVNAVAPNTVTNQEFTKTLGRVLNRPTLVPMPAFAARLVLGEMADALLLTSARVEPKELRRTGYDFRQPTLESALRHLLGRTL